ncbi:MAG: PilZ domain-containing protein [Candidatus Sulfotelmatobacter sp.]
MPDETDAGAAYLAALKRSATPQGAAAAPARAPEAARPDQTGSGSVAGPGIPGSNGADKRRSPRYRCQGSAHLGEIDSDVATWATFTDISLHGCYVEATATHRVGVALSLKLEANGFRLDARGEVRVAYPNLGMGISFTNLSPEDRERLRELVRSISRPSVVLTSRAAPDATPIPQSGASPRVANPAAALQAMLKFFEDRQMMGREEFLRILRKSQGPET